VARAVAGRLADRGTAAQVVVPDERRSATRADDRPLSEDGGKRLFVKEIEEALLSRRVDIAVHRAKDMPSDDLASLEVAAALPREDARDALILPGGAGTIPFAVERLPADPPLGPERKRST